MKAIVQHEYGGPEVFTLEDVAKPQPKDDEVLVRIHTAAIHPGDWLTMTGRPYVFRIGTGLRKPRRNTPGFDLAGTVEAVGKDVTDLHPGDEVFGEGKGTCAEFATAKAEALAPKPPSLSLDQAGVLAVSGVTAIKGLRDAGKLQPGMKVLINGASGGIGTYAVQIAKAMGAEVTGVCSTKNVELVRSLGADHVIDYTREDWTKGATRYDLILDNVGNHSLADSRRAATPNGSYLSNSGITGGRWFGPLTRMLKAAVGSIFIRNQGAPFYAPVKRADLAELTRYVEDGHVRPVVDRTYPLVDTAEAMAHVATGHASGKTAIAI
ncbi:MAG: NAD(P)-dependent alcohol dehydrogenase [Acidimicrobiia bacterium]|nr:NAD(P)-dependent alcohol dehydrogenase [Acidimicrobiia bacterium]